MVLRRPLLATALLALVATLGACGNKEDVTHEADTEGIYVDVGPFSYQVQISRQLNPADIEDRAYLIGLDDEQRELAPDEVWFGVFMRVENDSEDRATPVSPRSFKVVDTQENEYEPLELAADNVFAYEAEPLDRGAVIPHEDSIARHSPIGGSLLLFKLKRISIDNRPLELKIGGGETEGTVDLDV